MTARNWALALLALLAGAHAAAASANANAVLAAAARAKDAADADWVGRPQREAALEAARWAAERARMAETPEEGAARKRGEAAAREAAERAAESRASARARAAAAAPAAAPLIEGGPEYDDGEAATAAAPGPARAPAPGRAPRLRATDVLGTTFPGAFKGTNPKAAAPAVTPTPAGGPAAGAGMSLARLLTEDYNPASGGRGVAPGAAKAESGDEPRRALNRGDLMEEEGENNRPRRRAAVPADDANAFGARPGDVPVVQATPVLDQEAARPVDGLSASRLVLPLNASAPLWGFAAAASIDQPARRFRPPDQALCVGNGVALTGNNLVFRSWNATTGAPLQGPTSPQDFFNVSGDMSDPVCIYDAADTKRFYLMIFAYADSPIKKSEFLVAVSRTSDPADGWLGPYVVRNDGLDAEGNALPGLEGCKRAGRNDEAPPPAGCLGDYPSVGMDKHSLISAFNLFGDGYAGVLVLALSKADLVSGAHARPAVAAYSNWPPDLSYTIHPTTTQAGTPHDEARGGTLWIASTGPGTQNDPNIPALALWAVTRTSALAAPDFPGSGTPIVHRAALLQSPSFRDPASYDRLGLTQPAPGAALDPGDGRTLQAVYSGGLVWASSQTVMRVGGPTAEKTIGVIYWAVEPRWDGSSFAPRLVASGYAGVPGRFLGRPAITATRVGTAFIGVTLTGEDFFPSPAVVEVDLLKGPLAVRVPARAPGILYPTMPDELWAPKGEGKGYMRGGDYGAACLDEAGNAWTASEWAGGVPSPSCVKREGKGACPNWSTFVSRSVEAGAEAGAGAGTRAVDRVPAALAAGGGAPVVGRWGGPPTKEAGDAPAWLASAAVRAAEEGGEEEARERELTREARRAEVGREATERAASEGRD